MMEQSHGTPEEAHLMHDSLNVYGILDLEHFEPSMWYDDDATQTVLNLEYLKAVVELAERFEGESDVYLVAQEDRPTTLIPTEPKIDTGYVVAPRIVTNRAERDMDMPLDDIEAEENDTADDTEETNNE